MLSYQYLVHLAKSLLTSENGFVSDSESQINDHTNSLVLAFIEFTAL